MSQKCLSTSHFSLINLNCQQPLKQSTVTHFWTQIDSLTLRIVLTGHNLHATLVLSTGPSFSFKQPEWFHTLDFAFLFGKISKDSSQAMFSFGEKAIEQLDRMSQCFLEGGQ